MAQEQKKRKLAKEDFDQDQRYEETDKLDDFDYGDVLFAWDFPEYHRFQRGKWWYIIGAIVIIGLLYITISGYDISIGSFELTEAANPLFALIIIIALIILFLNERNKPEYIPFAITEAGILVHDYFYPYESLKDFFIIYEPPAIKTLYIEPKNFFSARIAVPLEDQDPSAIREALLEYIDEDLEKEEEPASDSIGKLFKF